MKFKCKVCDYVADLDNLLEEVYCPKCGKKYHNQYFKPVEEAEEPVAEEHPVVEQPVAEPEVSCVRRLNPAKIKAKKGAFVALLVFSLLYLAGVAVAIGLTYGEAFSGEAVVDVVRYVLNAYYAYILVGLVVMTAAATQVHAANIKLAAIKTIDTEREIDCCCPKVKSAKLAGYAFAIIFGLLMVIGAVAFFVLNFLDLPEGVAAVDIVKMVFTDLTFAFVMAGIAVVCYFSYRVKRVNNK